MNTPVHKQLLTLVNSYDMPEVAKKLLAEHPPLILCGITAAGKDTLAHELVTGDGFETVVSHTTRRPRENHGVLEADGANYHFIDESEMLELVTAKQFAEVKSVYNKDIYGTSIDALTQPIKRGHRPILEIDVQGVLELASAVPSLRPIFLLPPSFEVWRQRLQGRGQMPAEELTRRMQTAVKEIQAVMDNPAFAVVVNYDKTQTAQRIRAGMIERDAAAIQVAQDLVGDIQKHLQA